MRIHWKPSLQSGGGANAIDCTLRVQREGRGDPDESLGKGCKQLMEMEMLNWKIGCEPTPSSAPKMRQRFASKKDWTSAGKSQYAPFFCLQFIGKIYGTSVLPYTSRRVDGSRKRAFCSAHHPCKNSAKDMSMYMRHVHANLHLCVMPRRLRNVKFNTA